MERMSVYMNIGNKLRELRMEKGLTQEELADRAELSKGFISQIERDLTSFDCNAGRSTAMSRDKSERFLLR